MSMYRLLSCLIVMSVAVAYAQPADARSKRSGQIPNNDWSCGACHNNALGGGPLDEFGQQVEEHLSEPVEQADVDWQAIYDLDADGDGFTNGEELGDPNGDWESGDGDPEADPTNPADEDDFPETDGDTGTTPDTGMGDTGGMPDAGGESDAGGGESDVGGGKSDAGGVDPGYSGHNDDPESACSAVGGTPGRGLWLALVVGFVALVRRD